MVGEDGWLGDWNPRFARVLAQRVGQSTRAALVDTNGDGRELWFGFDVREPSGDWVTEVDWDDVSHERAPRPIAELPVAVGWGTGRPGQQHVVKLGGMSFSVQVERSGWWLFLAEADQSH